ncbi:MAG: valine--tRNA ligase [Bacteroidia bacterium]|nr:valine--tRNA ligase [Bacteroidia bacterium]
MEIAKKYSPKDIEDKWYEAWINAKVFKSTPDERESYTIVIPPPNVTGVLHMGHMLNNTIQDVLIRRARMKGFNACWVPGTDHASIATEAKVVRMLREQGIKKSDLSRDEFLGHAFEWKEKYGGIILKQLRKLGASCDWDRTSFTMDPEYSKSVIQVFVDLYNKGYIYRANRMVNWDPVAKTALSDEEVIFKEKDGLLYHVRYEVEGMEGEYLTIATTRPETILADTAVAVHPDDERYKHLHGKKAIIPIVNRAVPIITDDYVEMEFGTGALKVTPAHDVNDYEIGQRHELEVIECLNDDGTISDNFPSYKGMDRFKVRKQIAKDLDASGHLVEKKQYKNSVGHSERTDAVIEPRLSLQWWLDMKKVSGPALDAVNNGDVELVPAKFINTYRHWMENVKDWCLSRQLWWGHQIPAYYIKGTNEHVVAESAEAALELAKAKTGKKSLTMADLKQDEDVLDTWASSWLWPISVFKGLTQPENEDIKYYYPTDVLVTAPEILFFWVARMIISGMEYMGERPFKHVYLTGIVRDKQRRKMSKSLGNSPDPLDLIAENGADGVRFGMLFSSPAGNDLLFDESQVEQGRNFANKIWNAFRFLKSLELSEAEPSRREALAIEWLKNRVLEVGVEIEEYYDKFRLSDALRSIYKLIWDDYCSWFLEMIKPNYGDPISKKVLDSAIDIFEDLLKILHPFMPFLTEELYHEVRDREEEDFICVTQMPDFQFEAKSILQEMELIKEVISAVRNFRASKQISPKESIELYISTPEEKVFETYSEILVQLLNTSKIEFVSEKVSGAGSIRVKNHEFYIPLLNVDVEAEKDKILKEIEYTEGFLKSVMKKLSNERFVSNAPEKVVNLEKKKQSDAEEKLSLLRKSLEELG